jgi:hypothetical protein
LAALPVIVTMTTVILFEDNTIVADGVTASAGNSDVFRNNKINIFYSVLHNSMQ